MNGAGNAIVVLDLRGSSFAPSPEDTRAIHRAPGLAYDQMMALSDPKSDGTAAFVRIYNNDGTLAEACGNGIRCVADRLCRELGVETLELETEAGRIGCERLAPWSPGQHGCAAAHLGRHSARPFGRGHEAGRSRCSGPKETRSPRSVPPGRRHGQSARGLLRARPCPRRCGGVGRADRSPSNVPAEGRMSPSLRPARATR